MASRRNRVYFFDFLLDSFFFQYCKLAKSESRILNWKVKLGFSLLMLWKVQSYYCSIISNSLIESKWKGRSDTSSMLWRKCAWLKRIKSLLYIKFLSGYWDNFPVLFIVHNCYFASSFSHNFNFSHRLVFTFYFLSTQNRSCTNFFSTRKKTQRNRAWTK